MPETSSSIYEEPSRLSQGLVVGLSIAVVAMAGWFVATITLSPLATVPVEGGTEAAAGGAPVTAPTDGTAVSSTADAARQPMRSVPAQAPDSGSVFDWPQFPSGSPPPKTVLPLAPEVPPAGDAGRMWPVAAPGQDLRTEVPRTEVSRNEPSRSEQPRGESQSRSARQPGAAPEATDAIVDILAPAPPAKSATAPQPQRQAPRRTQQKPRTDGAPSDAAQQ
jgi:hypothetical protein